MYTYVNGMRIYEFTIRFVVFGYRRLRVINGLYIIWAIFGSKYSIRISAGIKTEGRELTIEFPALCPRVSESQRLLALADVLKRQG